MPEPPVAEPAPDSEPPAPLITPEGQGLSIVLPAYNEAGSVGPTVAALRQYKPAAEILVVDDGSTDATAAEARAAGARVLRHPYNKGNGAAVKTGIRAAGGAVVLMMDADGQHQPADADRLLALIGEYDLVVGARTLATNRGFLRDAGNAFFNRFAGYLVWRPIPDLTSGFRAFKRDHMLEFIHLLPNGYSYPTTSTLSFIKAGYNVAFVPIAARKAAGRSQIKIVRDGLRFVQIMLRIATLFSPMKVFLPISLLFLLTGAAYGLGNYVLAHRIPNGALLLLITSVFIFLFALISEQIAAMRFESTQRWPRE